MESTIITIITIGVRLIDAQTELNIPQMTLATLR